METAKRLTVATLDTRSRKLVLLVLCFCSFTVVFNNLVLSPLLVDVSGDLNVSLGLAGQLIAVYALSAGIFAIFTGPLIDRYGRQRILAIGAIAMGIATFASTIAPNFATLAALRGLAGLGVACVQPAVFAAVGDFFPYEERGRALAWVITANTFASVAGVPLGAIIAEWLSWRATFGLLGLVSLVAVFIVVTKFPKVPVAADEIGTGLGAYLSAYRRVLASRSVLVGMLSAGMGSMYWFAWVSYMGAFFIKVYGLRTGQLAPLTATLGLGVLLGGNLGGRLGDRLDKKPLIVWASVIGGLLIALQTNVLGGIIFAAAVNVLYAIPGGARFTNMIAFMTEIVPASRGTVMSLNSTFMQFGVTLGSTFAGIIVVSMGFRYLGLFCAVVAILSGLVVQLFIRGGHVPRSEAAVLQSR